MLKKICGLILLALLSAACGGSEGDQSYDQLGTLEQALTWNSGYGAKASNGGRCNPNWGGDLCILPAKKNMKVRIDCTGCTQRMGQAVTNFKTGFKTRMANYGFAITYVTSGYDVYANRGADPNCSTCLGRTYPSLLQDVYALSGPQSLASEAEFYTVYLNFDAVHIAGLTDQQQRNRYINLMFHEFGHTAGLGEDTSGVGCMFVTPQPGADVICQYNTEERAEMTAWVPNTND